MKDRELALKIRKEFGRLRKEGKLTFLTMLRTCSAWALPQGHVASED